MKWFRDRGAATATSAPAAEGAPPEPEVHPSLALPDLLHQLHPDRRLRILDLGPAVGANLDFLAALYPCTVQVADLYPSLAETGAGDPAAAIAAALPPAATQEPSLDLVLAWNLLDYLDRERIRSLAAHLARRCRPGALLFAMIGTRPEIPREPGSFVIRDPESLVYRQDPTRTRPGYRYRPRDIAGLTPGFNTDRNFLLRHGVQEYLLQREEDG